MTFVKTNSKNDFFPNVLGTFVDEFLSKEVNPFIEKTMVNRFPAANIIETETAFEIQLMAPGRKKSDFEIDVNKNILTISDVRETAKEGEVKTNFKKKEFSLETFKRSFTLSNKVDAENISAKYENGILYLNIAKKAEAVQPARKIAVS